MHHYCLVLSKISNNFSSKVCSYIHKDLIFKPEKMYFANFGETAVVSFQVNLGAFGIDNYCYFKKKEFVLVHGLPTFERHDASIIDIAKIDPAQAMMKIIGDMGFEAACQTLGGVFSIVYSDGLNAFFNSSFCGYGSAFYYADDNIFVISNRQNLVLAIVGSDKCRYNLDSASWILSTTMLIEHNALYTGIKKTMPGFTLIRHHDGTLENKVPVSRFDLPPSKGDVAYDELYDGLLVRYKYYLSLPIKWHAHITGGKDSRAALSAILASSKKSAIEKFITNGAKDNGDVQGNFSLSAGRQAAAYRRA